MVKAEKPTLSQLNMESELLARRTMNTSGPAKHMRIASLQQQRNAKRKRGLEGTSSAPHAPLMHRLFFWELASETQPHNDTVILPNIPQQQEGEPPEAPDEIEIDESKLRQMSILTTHSCFSDCSMSSINTYFTAQSSLTCRTFATTLSTTCEDRVSWELAYDVADRS